MPCQTKWLLRRGPPPFQHCFMFRYLSKRWMLYDWGLDGFHAQPVSRATIDDLVDDIESKGGILVRYDIQERAVRSWPPLVFSCVTVLSELLHLPGTVWTPRHLYRILRSRGAIELLEARNVDDGTEDTQGSRGSKRQDHGGAG
jgi:hypothetical protein